MRVLAIDPGPERSAWIRMGDGPTDFSIDPNESVLRGLRAGFLAADAVVIERIASYGMPVGVEIFETVYWSGRFAEASRPMPVYRIPRLRIKQALCHDSRANDATIRQALIDRYGGKERAIGRKAAPGPLYGIHADLWAALALAVTFADQAEP